MVTVGVVELALVHEWVVVGVTNPPAGCAGALRELIDCLTAAEVERDRDLRRSVGSADQLFGAPDVTMSV
ncbi:hypothetical protein J2T23_000479 [Pseudarthrobacter niigatensis]|uniref:Uncharacterized protein n=1 Tax=Pseudarthrobacter niigatensis TaxID=369935 RepID=A0AAJ1SPF4_9MICC|nr:hypothetical protein [Pseudarthrobacter niigatensis]MDQ0265251.1 hypothetical protein [Pseudarthrobacter niigatensis]